MTFFECRPQQLLTCFNPRDAGGVKHPLHLTGTHRDGPQSSQLRQIKIIKSSWSSTSLGVCVLVGFTVGGPHLNWMFRIWEKLLSCRELPEHVHHVPVCVCTAASHGLHYQPEQPVGVSESRTRGPSHKYIQHTDRANTASTQRKNNFSKWYVAWELIFGFQLVKNVFLYSLFPFYCIIYCYN